MEIKCAGCGKKFYRYVGRVNEAIKFHWKQYCTKKCQSRLKDKKIKLTCSKPGCPKIFFRQQKELNKSAHFYCSRSCAVSINNTNHIKRPAIIKACPKCKKPFTGDNKYCSAQCLPPKSKITKDEIIKDITFFFHSNNRIPFKQEYLHAKAARQLFGTWNKAILASGLQPNPVKFAKKYIANDSHKCDSLAEKIIDDWLFARKIPHKRTVPYPQDKRLTADFVINDFWIEFFGLAGEHETYDKLMQRKLYLVRKNHLNFIQIFPNDLFPKNKLESVLKPIYVK